MSHRRNAKGYKGVEKHVKPTHEKGAQKATKPANPHRWTRKVLAAMSAGAQLVFSRGRGWRVVALTGHAFKVKRKVLQTLLRDLNIGWNARAHKLILTVQGAALLSQIA